MTDIEDTDIVWFWCGMQWRPLPGNHVTKDMLSEYKYRILPTHKGPKSPPEENE